MNSKNFEEKFITDNLQGKRVIVAFSGGADSVSLLYRLIELKNEFQIKLEAFHLNHCLRGEESERDENFVRDFCKKHDVPLTVERLEISKIALQKGISEETCGREERYRLLSEIAKEDGIIVTAHTLSDNLETVIFHMIRGTALKGLCGIPQRRENIIRPILDCSREDVEDYCARKNLVYVTDSSNFSTNYIRNKIRTEIIPKFHEINPSVDQSFLRMQTVLQKEEDYLEKKTASIFENMQKEDYFSLKPLEEKDDIFYSRIAVKLLEYFSLSVDFQNVDRISLLLKKGKGRQQMGEDFYLKAQNGKLFFEKEKREIPFFEKEIELPITEKEIIICYKEVFKEETSQKQLKLKTQILDIASFKKIYKNFLIFAVDYDTIIGKLSLRQKKAGDSIKLFNRNGTKTLKKIFNENKVPDIERKKAIILSDEKGIVAAEYAGVCQKNAVTEKTNRVLVFLKEK